MSTVSDVVEFVRFHHALACSTALVFVLGVLVWSCLPAFGGSLPRRLLLMHGSLEAPKIVWPASEDELDIVTASGRMRFTRAPACDESLACALGFETMCWSRVR